MTAISMRNGVVLCVASSFLLAVGMAVLVVVEKHAYVDSIVGEFFAAYILWAMLGGVFSLMGALVIGVPVGILLEKAGMFRWYIVVPIGAAVSYWFGGSGYISSQTNVYFQTAFAVYGGVGALAFWFGASFGEPSQASSPGETTE